MRHVSLLLMMVIVPATKGADPAIDFFEKEVRPILIEHCQECHSAKKIKGGLRLTSRAELLKGGDSGAAIVPGKPKESLLIQAIGYTGSGELRMPPKGKLADPLIAKLTKWVEQGAVWPESNAEAISSKSFEITEDQRRFWSFQPLGNTPVPQVKNQSWCKSDIDRYVLSKIEAAGLKPAPEADKRTLIRRVTFDLTGLPPTPLEINQFLADNSANAFEKVIDRLLASSAYGERWGRHWLDVARYADSRDSRGVGGDTDILEAWIYRDWVIQAMNRDLPYDQFVKLQIAGDIVSANSPGGFNADALAATGFLAIGEWGTGDADKEKMVTDIVNDQVDIVSRSFLGLTVGCARCHDHKFDPVSIKDYYALAGIFFSSKILPSPGPKTNGSPMLRIPMISPKDQAERDRIAKQLKAIESAIAAKEQLISQETARKLLPETATYLRAAWDYLHSDKQPPPLVQFAKAKNLKVDPLSGWIETLRPRNYQLMAKLEREAFGIKTFQIWTNKDGTPNAMINLGATEVTAQTYRLPPRSVSVHPGPRNGIAVVWDAPVAGSMSIVGKANDADGTCGDGFVWQIVHGTKLLAEGVVNNGQGATFTGDKLKNVSITGGDRIELRILPRAAYDCDSTHIEFEIADSSGKKWNLTKDVLANERLNPIPDQYGHPNVWRFMDMADSKAPPAALAMLPTIGAMNDASVAMAHINEFAKSFKIVDTTSPFFTKPGELASDPSTKELREERDRLKAIPAPTVPMALTVQEGGIPGGMFPAIQDVPVHIRGSYTRLGEKIPRRFPEILSPHHQKPLSEVTKGSGRMELANFLASPTNPLTARVMVNRVWAWHFGEGIVRTPSNFGKLGERPTHPELLDRLTADFIAEGWSLKKLHKKMLLSATYQQSDATTEDVRIKDADNRLFTRANLRRIEAEAVRDSMLFVAGNLDRTAGGLSFADFNIPRRTVYLRTIRSDKSNFQALFDAADPETPTEKRNVSTVAPQALFLMNHPFAMAQSKIFSQRLQSETPDDKQRLRLAYDRLYGRPPSAEEEKVTLAFLKSANWDELARVLMCSNEFVYVK